MFTSTANCSGLKGAGGLFESFLKARGALVTQPKNKLARVPQKLLSGGPPM